MAKKSNKTEHVLKLIMKNEDVPEDDFLGIDPVSVNQGTEAPPKTAAEPKPKKTASPKKQEKNSNQKPEESSASKSEEVSDQTPNEEGKVKSEIQPEIEVKKPEQEQAAEEPVLRNAGSALIAQHDNPVNIAEILAKEKLTLVMSRMKVCTCSTCVNDVLALALNTLPTKYVTTDAGKQYFQLDIYKKQYETDVLAALTKACVRVKASPRHNADEVKNVK
jgi:competence protein ComFB